METNLVQVVKPAHDNMVLVHVEIQGFFLPIHMCMSSYVSNGA